MATYFTDIVATLAGRYDVSEQFVRHYVYLALIIIVALIIGLVFKKLVVPLIKRIILKTPFKFDDYLFSDETFNTFSHIIPAFIIFALFPLCFTSSESSSLIYIIINRAINIYITILVAHLITKVLNNVLRYSKSDYSENANNHYLDAIVQFIKVIIYFFATVVVIAVAIDRNPTTLLAGLGAMATVLILVFQDPILGFVAGLQLNANKMLEVGDWIEIKNRDINGTVIKVNLTTIKIRNFDNSISTIPPYKLVSETFKNWKGIRDYAGRQVRKTLNIDMSTICFVDADMMNSLGNYWVSDNIKKEIVLGKTTNAWLYRKHIENYLSNHLRVKSDDWLMVRQLDSTAFGMALELYFYLSETGFEKYEGLVAEIYEYCIAATSKFNLKIYQSMSYGQK